MTDTPRKVFAMDGYDEYTEVRLPPSARKPAFEQVRGCKHRLATLEDVPELASLACRILRHYPGQEIQHPKASIAEYTRYRDEKMVYDILAATKRVYLAEHPVTGSFVGFMVISRVGLGDENLEPLPPVRYPDGSHMDRISKWSAESTAWKAQSLKKYGPHLRGESLGVDLSERRNFIATGLCKIFAEEAERLKVPVFFDTCYHSVGYYERFCDGDGYRLKMVGSVPLDEKSMVIYYRFQVLKAAPKTEVPVERERPLPLMYEFPE